MMDPKTVAIIRWTEDGKDEHDLDGITGGLWGSVRCGHRFVFYDPLPLGTYSIACSLCGLFATLTIKAAT